MKWLVLIFLFSISATAAQKATVVTEGAIVYKGPSFDAPILGYFSAGKKVNLSNKLFGAFYKVRFKQGVIGYISDIDVRTENGKNPADTYFSDSTPPTNMKQPFFGATYLGLQLAMINYEDTVGGYTDSSATNFIGGVFTTPLSFFDGAFLLSLSALYSLEVPDFYTKISKQKPDGYVVIGDLQLLYPLSYALKRKLIWFVGAGIGLAYTSVDLVQEIGGVDKLIPTSSAKVGGSFSGGFIYQFSKTALRIEPKYFYEENAYFGITSSFAFQF